MPINKYRLFQLQQQLLSLKNQLIARNRLEKDVIVEIQSVSNCIVSALRLEFIVIQMFAIAIPVKIIFKMKNYDSKLYSRLLKKLQMLSDLR